MATYTGGQRARLIWDSLYWHVFFGLQGLAWFDPSDDYEPVWLIAEPWDNLEEIPRNTLTVTPEDLNERPLELGSQLTEHRVTYWIEFLAENATIGTHLIYDIKDLIEGRMGSLGYNKPNFPVFDFDAATPPILFNCDIEDVVIDHGKVARETWKSNWHGCSFVVVDSYANEDDD